MCEDHLQCRVYFKNQSLRDCEVRKSYGLVTRRQQSSDGTIKPLELAFAIRVDLKHVEGITPDERARLEELWQPLGPLIVPIVVTDEEIEKWNSALGRRNRRTKIS